MIKVCKHRLLVSSSDQLSFIKHGLLDEIRSLQQTFSSPQAAVNGSSVDVQDESKFSVTEPDYTLGIYQCIGTRNLATSEYALNLPIGFKEFREFLSLPSGSQEVFDKAVENMKQSTRKYAKRQVTWLRNKLLPAIDNVNRHSGNKIPMASMYILDATGRYMLNNLSIVDRGNSSR